VALGICISVFGTNAGAALVSPRRFYALAEQGDLPKMLARTDPNTGAPRAAIIVTFVLSAGLTLTGTFKELAILSVVARFMQYIPTCLATMVFRARDPKGEAKGGFRLPLGPVLPVGTVFLCLWLLASSDPTRLLMGGLALLVGAGVYGIKKRVQGPVSAPGDDDIPTDGFVTAGNGVMGLILVAVVVMWGVRLFAG
jgi:basic amino acid/polyamine antiporter, APA family